MSLSSGLKILEDLTSNAKQIQDDVIKEILKLNAKTEYLQRFLHESSDKELFKKKVPVVSYEDVKPYIERVVDGDSSDIISGKPITEFILRYFKVFFTPNRNLSRGLVVRWLNNNSGHGLSSSPS